MTQIESNISEDSLRKGALLHWFQELVPQLSKLKIDVAALSLESVSGDASFRRYFRTRLDGKTYILVDAPPNKEDSHPFVSLAKHFISRGINVPKVLEVDYEAGFMCLSDFGDILLWQKLDEAQKEQTLKSDDLYHLAFTQLLKIQSCNIDAEFSLPLFDDSLLHREMLLFKEWFCETLLEVSLSDDEVALLESSFQFLIKAALEQPQVCVHRDYHSRNLMVLDEQSLGVIDFQDAVLGPITYDLVSLLKDCYIQWPRSQVNTWALQYSRLAIKENDSNFLQDESIFLKSFDLMGVQRHLKAIGIFSRLYLRDSKSAYLGDIPRTLSYIRDVAEEHEELHEFSRWLEQTVVPHVEAKISDLLAAEKPQ